MVVPDGAAPLLVRPGLLGVGSRRGSPFAMQRLSLSTDHHHHHGSEGAAPAARAPAPVPAPAAGAPLDAAEAVRSALATVGPSGGEGGILAASAESLPPQDSSLDVSYANTSVSSYGGSDSGD